MNRILEVCLVALTLAANTPFAPAQSPALQKGINVQMAETSNAVVFPAADSADAWIIAVTADGHLYFGVKPVTGDELVQEMKATPRNRAARLYIKGDAHAPFEAVKQALHAAHEDLFETAILLTEQAEHGAAAGSFHLKDSKCIWDYHPLPRRWCNCIARIDRPAC